MMKMTLMIFGSYLLGCFTTGYYLVRFAASQDIRTFSSGNVGSRNVGRLLGIKGFVLTLVGDAGKGLLTVWVAQQAAPEAWFATVALLAVTAGHIWPAQLRFRGGKGLATFAGGMILLQPLVLATGLMLGASLYPLLKGITKSGMIALGCSPFIMMVLFYRDVSFNAAELLLYCALVVMVLYAHRANIRKDFFGSTPSGG